MAEIAYRNEGPASVIARPNWGAIWAGMFTFLAIWSVFGLLGEAIFASSTSPHAANPVGGGIDWGISVWSIILTAISMYVAGRITSHVSGVQTRSDAIAQGQVMFGLSAAAIAILVLLAGALISGGNVNASEPYAVHVLTTVGWPGFVAFFLGWVCAMGGAAHNVKGSLAGRTTSDNVRDIRAA